MRWPYSFLGLEDFLDDDISEFDGATLGLQGYRSLRVLHAIDAVHLDAIEPAHDRSAPNLDHKRIPLAEGLLSRRGLGRHRRYAGKRVSGIVRIARGDAVDRRSAEGEHGAHAISLKLVLVALRDERAGLRSKPQEHARIGLFRLAPPAVFELEHEVGEVRTLRAEITERRPRGAYRAIDDKPCRLPGRVSAGSVVVCDGRPAREIFSVEQFRRRARNPGKRRQCD